MPGGFLFFLPGPALSLRLTCIELWALEQQGLQERAVELRPCGGQGPGSRGPPGPHRGVSISLTEAASTACIWALGSF